MEDKKIFSLNLAAYLVYKGYTYAMGFDEESARFYFIVEDSDGVYNDIKEYKSRQVNVNLFEFTKAYKKIRDEIKNLRSSEEFGIKYAGCKIRALWKNKNERVDEDEID